MGIKGITGKNIADAEKSFRKRYPGLVLTKIMRVKKLSTRQSRHEILSSGAIKHYKVYYKYR